MPSPSEQEVDTISCTGYATDMLSDRHTQDEGFLAAGMLAQRRHQFSLVLRGEWVPPSGRRSGWGGWGGSGACAPATVTTGDTTGPGRGACATKTAESAHCTPERPEREWRAGVGGTGATGVRGVGATVECVVRGGGVEGGSTSSDGVHLVHHRSPPCDDLLPRIGLRSATADTGSTSSATTVGGKRLEAVHEPAHRPHITLVHSWNRPR